MIGKDQSAFGNVVEPGHGIVYKIVCCPEKIDQPAHPLKLIRVFAVGLKTLWIIGYPRSSSEDTDQTVDAQAGLCDRWPHMQS